MRVDWEVSHQLERGASISEDAGPLRGGLEGPTLIRDGERVSARTLGLRGDGL